MGYKIKLNELSMLVGKSAATINVWYQWKSAHPDHELAKLLPAYEKVPPHNCKVWNSDDVESIIKFSELVPKGRGGILSDVSQKYVKKKEGNNKCQNNVKPLIG